MNARQFLMIGGVVLIALGVLGYVGLGPTPGDSALGEFFYLTPGENVAHLTLGVVALLAYYFLKDAQLTKWLVILVGIIAALAAVIGFMNADVPPLNVGVANLENPADNILHVVVAVWAFWASMKKA